MLKVNILLYYNVVPFKRKMIKIRKNDNPGITKRHASYNTSLGNQNPYGCVNVCALIRHIILYSFVFYMFTQDEFCNLCILLIMHTPALFGFYCNVGPCAAVLFFSVRWTFYFSVRNYLCPAPHVLCWLKKLISWQLMWFLVLWRRQ